jgi:hypothetical protein
MRRTHYLMNGSGWRAACGRRDAHLVSVGTVKEWRAVHVAARCIQCARVLAQIIGQGMLDPKGESSC